MPQPAEAPKSRQRDPRLDFFRGAAMFIILLAHTPGNTWTLWIPARFGFSDATEIFVFSSGMASALAFGSVFAQRSWFLGAARVAFRVWQVYWAHIGVFIVTALFLVSADLYDWGDPELRYLARPYVAPFFEQTPEALVGLLTLTYVPGLFDILPMYLVILGMIPVVMALWKLGGGPAVAAFATSSWVAASLAGVARGALKDGWEWGQGALIPDLLIWFGCQFQFLNFPSYPWGDNTWFFNPFAWQLVFFTGFAFGMKWLPAPPVSRRLIGIALCLVLFSIPFAWFKIHRGLYLPDAWLVHDWIADFREWARPLWTKTWFGAFRYIHFLALAYLGWVAVGPRGALLSEGVTLPPRARPPRPAVLWGLVVLAVLTIPYAYIDEIKALSPALDTFFLSVWPSIPGDRLGMLQIAHLAALLALFWLLAPQRWRDWLTRDLVVRATPVIRKVGTQSLAVFMTSIPLAQMMALTLDVLGRNVWTTGAVNLVGFALLTLTAYFASWIKGHPWRRPIPREASVAPPSGTPAE